MPPSPIPDPDLDGYDAAPPGLDLPPPPERALPPWLEAARERIGLDGRAWAWIAAAVVALLVGAWLLRPGPAAVEETLPMATTASGSAPVSGAGGATTVPPASSTSVPTEVVVHAAGAVVHPGVYTLDAAARVDDLVRAAGGLAPDADSARINLAAPLADGARVYVPRVGEAEPPAVVDGGGPGPTVAGDPSDPSAPGGAPTAPDAPIDLNTATETELEELPGVGPSIAAAIVAFRQENGGFTSVEDLLDVRGIGEAKLDEIRPLVTV